MKRLIFKKVARCEPASLRKKVSDIFLHIFCLHSLLTHNNYFFRKSLWNCACKISFRKYKQKVVLLAIYLFNCSSSKSTSFMLNVAFDFVLVRFSSNKLECIAMQRLQKHSSFLIVCVLICSILNKKLIALHHNDILFYSILRSVLNTHFQQQSWRWRNDNISLDVCLNYSMKQLFNIWHLYQTHSFSNNLNDGEMITFYLMFELRNILWSKYLGKTCFKTKPFLHSKIKKT